MVNKNFEAVVHPLTAKEEEVKQYILETFFKPLKKPHWEGIEVKNYWTTLQSLN